MCFAAIGAVAPFKCVRCEVDRKSCDAQIESPHFPKATTSAVSSDTIVFKPRPPVAQPTISISAPAPAPISVVPPSVPLFEPDPTSPLHLPLSDHDTPTGMPIDVPDALSRKRSLDVDAPTGHSLTKLARTSNPALRANRGASSASSSRRAVGGVPSPAGLSPSSSRSGVSSSVFASRLVALDALLERNRHEAKSRADQNYYDAKARIEELRTMWEEVNRK